MEMLFAVKILSCLKSMFVVVAFRVPMISCLSLNLWVYLCLSFV